QPALLKHRRGRVDISGGNFQNLGGGIHDQTREPPVVFHHQNPVTPAGLNILLAKSFAQIDNRDNLAPQIDNPFHVVWRIRHRCDLGHAHDLVQSSDGHAISFTSHLEADDV